MSCQILPFLPGYMFCDGQLRSTGIAVAPTQHVNPKNGEVRYYVRPLWEGGAGIGLYVRRQGILDAIA